MKALFDGQGNPVVPDAIRQSIVRFGNSYNQVVCEIIENSDNRLDKDVFCRNVATLIPNFKMTRKGPFEGIKIHEGKVQDPRGIIAGCWKEVGNKAMSLRDVLDSQNKGRVRVLVEVPPQAKEEIAAKLWVMFKQVVPICMGQYTFGLVGASKILFAILPEVALPIDNNQWLNVFRTIDYGDSLWPWPRK